MFCHLLVKVGKKEYVEKLIKHGEVSFVQK